MGGEHESITFCKDDDDDPKRQQGDGDAQEGRDERIDEVAVQNHRADFPFLIPHHFQQGDDVIVLLDRQRRQGEQDAESDEGRPANQDVHHEIHILVDRFVRAFRCVDTVEQVIRCASGEKFT